jgi:hypothetical protein
LLTDVNELKLVIAVFCCTDNGVVLPATAEIGVTDTVKLTVLVVLATTLFTSRTLNTTLAVAYVTVGVPDTRPELLSIVTPVGNAPELT